MTVWILFIAFLFLLCLGVPIGVSIGLASLASLIYENEIPLAILSQRMFVSVNSFTLLAIPFFMLAGSIMDKSGITERLVEFSNSIVGWMRAGMCHVSVVTGMLMGGISGSAPADTAALSSVMIPSMSKMGYPKSFSAALQAASGSIGIIIPPSIPMVVMGGITGVSVGSLFLGGILPGIFIGVSLMITAGYICGKRGYGEKAGAFSVSNVLHRFWRALLPLMAPVIIIGGILTGVFTPTESSVIAVVFTLFVGIFVYRSLKLNMMKDIFSDAAVSSANVMLIVATSSLFSWILTRNDVPDAINHLLGGESGTSPFVVMLVANIIFFIGGMFIEGLALIIMFVPIFLPIVEEAGISPLVFCIMTVINIAIGTLTPPVGVCLFVASSSAGIKLEESSRSILPFILTMVVCLILTGVFPALVTFIPEMTR